MSEQLQPRDLWSVHAPERGVTKHYETKEIAKHHVDEARELRVDVSLYPPGKLPDDGSTLDDVGEDTVEFNRASELLDG